MDLDAFGGVASQPGAGGVLMPVRAFMDLDCWRQAKLKPKYKRLNAREGFYGFGFCKPAGYKCCIPKVLMPVRAFMDLDLKNSSMSFTLRQ